MGSHRYMKQLNNNEISRSYRPKKIYYLFLILISFLIFHDGYDTHER